MKERLIITEKSLIESTKHIAKEYDKEDVAEHTIEQVPENWEELKELCKDITVDLKLTKDGKIYCYEHLLAENRTPQQMWQIIKSLIGEE